MILLKSYFLRGMQRLKHLFAQRNKTRYLNKANSIILLDEEQSGSKK